MSDFSKSPYSGVCTCLATGRKKPKPECLGKEAAKDD